MLAATSEVRTAVAAMRSTLVFERAVRGTVVRRQALAFDTKYLARAAGKVERAGHLFLLVAGRFVSDRGDVIEAPVAHLLTDEEMERPTKTSRTFRTDGERVDAIHLRIASDQLRAPIGMSHGPLAVTPACWTASAALLEEPADTGRLAQLLDAFAGAGVISPALTQTVCVEEPERFRRLWAALQPLYATYGATTSLKQLAASLDMSMRQVGRDAKELSTAFGLGGGYRDALLVLRLRVGVLMLSAADATVADVARLVGYGSPIALARAFRDAKLPAPSAIQADLRGQIDSAST